MATTSLRKMPFDKVNQVLRALGDMGINPSDLLDLTNGVSRDEQQLLLDNWPRRGVFYDGPAIFDLCKGGIILDGMTERRDDAFCRTGQVSIYYDGQSVAEIRDTALARKYMDSRPTPPQVADLRAPTGVYALKLPVPSSQDLSYAQQQQLISLTLPGYEPAPLPVLLLATLVCLKVNRRSPISGWCRSADHDGNCYGLGYPRNHEVLSIESMPYGADDADRYIAAAKMLK